MVCAVPAPPCQLRGLRRGRGRLGKIQQHRSGSWARTWPSPQSCADALPFLRPRWTRALQWGAVEREPGQYTWTGYKQLLEVIRPTGLKLQVRLLRAQHGPEGHQGNSSVHAACSASLDYMRRAPLHAAQVVLSFHACGGNVGDTAHVPLPQWVLRCGENDPDLFFTDRPRGGSQGQRNREYLSVWADDAQGVLHGRSPMQCYEDFMASFRDNFLQVTGHPCAQTRAAAQQPCSD